jgi:hypothetical protein
MLELYNLSWLNIEPWLKRLFKFQGIYLYEN